MSPIVKLTLAAVLVVCVAAGALTARGRSDQRPDELRELRDRIESLEGTPATRVVTIREAPAATPVAAGGPVVAEEMVSKPKQQSETQEEREHRLTVINETRREACVTTHRRETVDPTWSATAADTIRARLVGEAFEGVGSTVDCRRTICRVDVKYGNPSAGMSAMKEIGSMRLWPGQTFWHVDQERNEAVAYIGRQGFELPTGDPTL